MTYLTLVQEGVKNIYVVKILNLYFILKFIYFLYYL